MGHGSGVYISQLEFSYTVGWKYKLVKHLWKTVWQYLVELNIYTPHDLTIPLTGVYLIDDVCTCTYQNMHSIIFCSKTKLGTTQVYH